MTQAAEAKIDGIENIPAALPPPTHKGPPYLPNSKTLWPPSCTHNLRLMYSRLGSHLCPNGHYIEPTVNAAIDKPLSCPVCGAVFKRRAQRIFPSTAAEPAQPAAAGLIRTVDESTLVPDASLTIDQGAVAPWEFSHVVFNDRRMQGNGRSDRCPLSELTDQEREIVFHGPAVKSTFCIRLKQQSGRRAGFTYYNAVYTVENALAKVKDDSGMKRVEKFFETGRMPRLRRLTLKSKSPFHTSMRYKPTRRFSYDS